MSRFYIYLFFYCQSTCVVEPKFFDVSFLDVIFDSDLDKLKFTNCAL